VLVAVIGGIATYIFNRRQQAAEDARNNRALAIQRIQTLQAFMPELRSEDERSKEAAVLAITSLGDSELMSRVAQLFRSEGVVEALATVATTGASEAAALALIAVETSSGSPVFGASARGSALCVYGRRVLDCVATG
jgi:hypothetical protein